MPYSVSKAQLRGWVQTRLLRQLESLGRLPGGGEGRHVLNMMTSQPGHSRILLGTVSLGTLYGG